MSKAIFVSVAALVLATGVAYADNSNIPSYSPYATMTGPQEGRAAATNGRQRWKGARPNGGFDNAYPNSSYAPGMGNPSNH